MAAHAVFETKNIIERKYRNEEKETLWVRLIVFPPTVSIPTQTRWDGVLLLHPASSLPRMHAPIYPYIFLFACNACKICMYVCTYPKGGNGYGLPRFTLPLCRSLIRSSLLPPAPTTSPSYFLCVLLYCLLHTSHIVPTHRKPGRGHGQPWSAGSAATPAFRGQPPPLGRRPHRFRGRTR